MENRKGILIKLPNQMHKDLKKYCALSGYSMQAIIQMCVESKISNLKVVGYIK